ncbi:hypothetical protein X943_000989 [Babesia divergens]|uniref:Uncharacterized protein n=1 Tax=Babesia divergens TaxID=32595 RepID=A0AAD9LHR6_BABDI|nr:hypothetical protein X943_000989 [Babesia divergens]
MAAFGIICLLVAFPLCFRPVFHIARCLKTSPSNTLPACYRSFRSTTGQKSTSIPSREGLPATNLKIYNARAIATVSPPDHGDASGLKGSVGGGDSGVVYFYDLISRSVDDIKGIRFDCYSKKCERVNQILKDAFVAVMPVYIDLLSRKLQPTKEALNASGAIDIMELVNSKSNILDDAIVGIVRHYLEMTESVVQPKTGWFFYGGSTDLNVEESVRLKHLLQLLESIEVYMYKLFREHVVSYKSAYVSKLFGGENAMLRLTEQRFAAKIQREFASGIKKLIPRFFQINVERKKLVGEILRYLAKADPSLSDSIIKLKGSEAHSDIIDKIAFCMTKWNVLKDVEEFSMLVTRLNNEAKSLLKRHLQDDEKQEKLLQVMASQQQQIETYQKQLGLRAQGSLPLSCGFSYRMPNTNLNVVGSIQRYVYSLDVIYYSRGKGNLQISCVPDESARLLGPYGFTSGVLPGNIGLSVNVDI